jgi:hypothetical protein
MLLKRHCSAKRSPEDPSHDDLHSTASGHSSPGFSGSPARPHSAGSHPHSGCWSQPGRSRGAFGALLAPSALSLLTITFHNSPDRPKAFGIFSAIATGRTSVGLLLGGVLIQTLFWRWCLYVNLLFAIPAAIAASRLVDGSGPQRPRPRIDFAGVGATSAGFFCLVYGFPAPRATRGPPE